MSRRPARRLAGAALAATLLCAGGCAWADRDNRPVWNAMEEHLVPEDDALYYATLPLTFPGGILAFLFDTFVVHPAMVVDDAFEDTADLWRHTEWTDHYYTEMASVPFRAALTPIAFVISFLGRSAFDLPSRAEAESKGSGPEVGDGDAGPAPASTGGGAGAGSTRGGAADR